MALEERHFRSVGEIAKQQAEAGTIDPMLIYVLLGVVTIGIVGAGWFVFTMMKERSDANRMLKEFEEGA